MIPTAIIFLAIFEFLKMLTAEEFVAWNLRTKEIAKLRKEAEAKNAPKPEFQNFEILSLILLPVVFVYLFVLFWVAVFGDNIFAQGLAIGLLFLSFTMPMITKKISDKAVKTRVVLVIIDSFLSVVMLSLMAYFYQKGM